MRPMLTDGQVTLRVCVCVHVCTPTRGRDERSIRGFWKLLQRKDVEGREKLSIQAT